MQGGVEGWEGEWGVGVPRGGGECVGADDEVRVQTGGDGPDVEDEVGDGDAEQAIEQEGSAGWVAGIACLGGEGA